MPHCHHGTDHRSDYLTNISAVGELLSSFVSDAYWLGKGCDVLFDLQPELLELSYIGFGVGLALAACSASGTTYCHKKLNTHHQLSAPQEEDAEQGDQQSLFSSSKISVWQYLALVGDFISHTGNIAGPLTFVIDLATKGVMPRW